MKTKLTFLFALLPLISFAQAVLNADGTTNTYSLINSVLAPGATAVETPDAFDPTFGPHIKQVWDTDLGKYVFEFYLHISNSNELQDESTGDTDRQRVEIKTYASSPDSMKGTVGETVIYKWRFKIPFGFQPSPSFTHIHQVKAVDGDDSDPIFTLTPRYNSNGNQLELIYVQDVNSGASKLATVDIASFLGNWVEATEQIYVDSINGAKNGNYSIVIKKVSDGTTLLSYSNNNISTIRKTTNSFIRPKWGIYRSITNISYLRDETMRFNSISVQEIKNQTQTITFGSLSPATYGDGNFDPGATSSSNLNITYSSSNPAVATIVNDSIHIVGAGTTIITAYQTGNASFAAASPVNQTLTVNKADQTIAFGAITKAVGDADFSPAIASSGLTCTYQSSNTAVATIVSGKVHIVGAGTTSITASQSGNTNYNAATDNLQILTVTTSALYTYSPTSVTVLSGSTGSGSYTNLASNDASYLRLNSTTSGTRTLDWYGSVTISQSASSIAKLIINYDGRIQFSKTQLLYLYNFSTLSWAQIDSRTVSTSDITISNEQTSPANYISSGGEIRLRVYSSGGTQNYSCSADWMQFTLQNITKSNQSISFNTLASKTYGDADFSPGATASSGLPISYSSSNTSVATIVNGQIHIVGAGSSNITASQIGDSYTNAAADVVQTLTVSKQNQTITFGAIASKSIGMADFDPAASASSSLGVTYSSSNTAVATIVSGLVHIVGIGTSTITTSQAGDANTNAAPDASQILTVTAATTVLMEETFNYSVTNLENESSWTTPAFLASTGTSVIGTGRNIVSQALTYTNSGRTYVLSGSGKKINSDYTSGATDYKNYKSFTSTPLTSGTVYLSFIFNAGVAQTQSQAEVFGLATGTSSGAKIWIGKGAISTSNYRFGTTRGSSTSADIKWGTTEFSDLTSINLLVLKYDFTTQTSSVYINPTIASVSEPTAETSDNTSSTVRTSLNNLWFRCNGSSPAKYNISGARVSTTWADAVASATVLSQSITFAALPSKLTSDADFAPGATASSGLAVTYTSSNTAVATIVNGQIHIIGGGTCTITASQNGNTSFASATSVGQTLTVNKLSQTITFGALSSKVTSDADFSPGATASSGLTVTYASSNTAVATIVSNQIHIIGSGTTTITASQVGNSTYNAATDVSQSFTVNNVTTPQTITFNALPTKTYGDADFSPGATASSGLTVSYTSSNTAVATIVNGQIHIVGAGSSNITASQAGDNYNNAATDVTQTLTVSKQNQTITFGALPSKSTGMADFSPGATASSGLVVSYTSSNTSVATILNGQIHIIGAGNTIITASQAGDTNTNAATDVTQQLTVSVTSTVLLEETFNFSDFPTAAGTAENWTTTLTGSPTVYSRTTETPALTYPVSGTGYVNSGSGKVLKCLYTGVTGASYASYKPINNGSSVTSGIVYLSFLYKVQARGGSYAQIIGMTSSGTSTGGVHLWYEYLTTTTFKLGISRYTTTTSTAGNVITYSSTLDATATYFIVVKYDIDNKIASFFVNPTIGSATESGVSATDDGSNLVATSLTSLSHLIIRATASSNSNFYIGGIRVSTSWADAVASNEITTNTQDTEISCSIKIVNKEITTTETGSMQIYNLQGKLLVEKKNINHLTTNLNSGLYIVRFITNEGKNTIQKIIIQ